VVLGPSITAWSTASLWTASVIGRPITSSFGSSPAASGFPIPGWSPLSATQRVFGVVFWVSWVFGVVERSSSLAPAQCTCSRIARVFGVSGCFWVLQVYGIFGGRSTRFWVRRTGTTPWSTTTLSSVAFITLLHTTAQNTGTISTNTTRNDYRLNHFKMFLFYVYILPIFYNFIHFYSLYAYFTLLSAPSSIPFSAIHFNSVGLIGSFIE